MPEADETATRPAPAKRPRRPHAPDLTIEVTPEIIQDSIQADSSHCMIAEAVKLAYSGAKHVSVDLQTIRLSDPRKGLRFIYLTPRTAQKALVDFDTGRLPEPWNFRLRSGMVTAMSRRRKGEPPRPPRSETEAAARARTGAALQELQGKGKGRQRIPATERDSAAERAAAGHAELRTPRRGSATNVPIRTGGQTPPTTPFARRRSFGLRALERQEPGTGEILRHTEGFVGEQPKKATN